MYDLRARYNDTMRETLDFSQGLFTVRLFDGMDGCWCDLPEATGVTADEALKVWSDRTDGGSEKTSYNDIDYFCIFPADTKMKWDGSEGREMFR